MRGDLCLEKAKEILELKIALRDSFVKEKWLKVGDMPPLSAPLGEVLSNTLLVKSKATKLINWLMESNGMRLGEGFFPGWLHKIDPALFVNTADLMPGLKNKEEISLDDIIKFKDMKSIKGIGNGNLPAITKESKVKTWLGFLKIVIEWREIVLENTIEKAVPKNKPMVKRKKNEVEEILDTDDDDFVSKRLVKPKGTDKVLKEKSIPNKRSNVVKGISKTLKRKLPNVEKERRNSQSGADDDTHLALALQISRMDYENRQEEINERCREKEVGNEISLSKNGGNEDQKEKERTEKAKKLRAAEKEESRRKEARKLKEAEKEKSKKEEATKLKEAEKEKSRKEEARKLKEAEKEQSRKEKARKLKEAEKEQSRKEEARKLKEAEKEQSRKEEARKFKEAEKEQSRKEEAMKLKEAEKENNPTKEKESDEPEELEEGEISGHDMIDERCENELDSSYDIFEPTPEKKRKRGENRNSFRELFGAESSDDDYDKRRPSGTISMQQQAPSSPSKISFSDSDSDSMLSPSARSSSTSSIFSPLSRDASSPSIKTVKLTNQTVTNFPEKQMTNKADLTNECRKKKSQNKTIKKLTYAAPAIETEKSDENNSSSSDEDLYNESNHKEAKELKKLVSKAQINPEHVKMSLKENRNIMTPINLQLVGWKKILVEKETMLEVDLSDSRYIYKFLMTDQFSWMFGVHIKMNMILTVTEIKKKHEKMIVMHMMIDKKLQVNKRLGKPVNM